MDGEADTTVVEQLQEALPGPANRVSCVRESKDDDLGACAGSKYATAERVARHSAQNNVGKVGTAISTR